MTGRTIKYLDGWCRVGSRQTKKHGNTSTHIQIVAVLLGENKNEREGTMYVAQSIKKKKDSYIPFYPKGFHTVNCEQ